MGEGLFVLPYRSNAKSTAFEYCRVVEKNRRVNMSSGKIKKKTRDSHDLITHVFQSQQQIEFLYFVQTIITFS